LSGRLELIMVFPLSDDNSDRRTFPFVNLALIAVNVLVFVVFQRMGEDDQFTYAFSTVPYRIVTGDNQPIPQERLHEHPLTGERHIVKPEIPATPVSAYLTLLTSLFLHGSIMHIAGNMWFLYIFGDNVEDFLGHGLYLIYYFLNGIAASLAHVFATVLFYGADSQQALVPSLGASGAISGVLGGYIVLFPQKPVLVILFRFLTHVPAWVAIGVWFAFQVVSGLPMLGGQDTGGVAYAAHVGGFVAGVVLILPFAAGGPAGTQRVPWSGPQERESW
jgi:membrane associated rhomboid family serine protease